MFVEFYFCITSVFFKPNILAFFKECYDNF
jgi:hypothetical protein